MRNLLAICALVAVLPSCASKDGITTQFDANPIHATPVVNQISTVRDATVDTTASIASEVLDAALEPIRFFFEASTPGYRFGGNDPNAVGPATPEERLSQRRQQMGLPQTAENRAEARRSQIRARIGMRN